INNTSNGIHIVDTFKNGASLSQSILIDPSTISGNLGAGILIRGRFYDGGSFIQNVSILGNEITSNSAGGIIVDNAVTNRSAGGAASLTQGLVIAGNSIAYNGGISSSGVSFAVTGGGIDIKLAANNIATNGTVALHSAIDISNNT